MKIRFLLYMPPTASVYIRVYSQDKKGEPTLKATLGIFGEIASTEGNK